MKRLDKKAVILQSEVRVLKKAIRSPGYADTHGKGITAILKRLEDTFRAFEPTTVAFAEHQFGSEGEIEIDEGATCSRAETQDDGSKGCYVMAWVWVYDYDVDAAADANNPVLPPCLQPKWYSK